MRLALYSCLLVIALAPSRADGQRPVKTGAPQTAQRARTRDSATLSELSRTISAIEAKNETLRNRIDALQRGLARPSVQPSPPVHSASPAKIVAIPPQPTLGDAAHLKIQVERHNEAVLRLAQAIEDLLSVEQKVRTTEEAQELPPTFPAELVRVQALHKTLAGLKKPTPNLSATAAAIEQQRQLIQAGVQAVKAAAPAALESANARLHLVVKGSLNVPPKDRKQLETLVARIEQIIKAVNDCGL